MLRVSGTAAKGSVGERRRKLEEKMRGKEKTEERTYSIMGRDVCTVYLSRSKSKDSK